MIRRLVEFTSWWLWRRWRIYCPNGDMSHLFKQHSLFDYDEAFIAPCVFNEIWCGGVRGRWTPKIRIVATEPCEDA